MPILLRITYLSLVNTALTLRLYSHACVPNTGLHRVPSQHAPHECYPNDGSLRLFRSTKVHSLGPKHEMLEGWKANRDKRLHMAIKRQAAHNDHALKQ